MIDLRPDAEGKITLRCGTCRCEFKHRPTGGKLPERCAMCVADSRKMRARALRPNHDGLCRARVYGTTQRKSWRLCRALLAADGTCPACTARKATAVPAKPREAAPAPVARPKPAAAPARPPALDLRRPKPRTIPIAEGRPAVQPQRAPQPRPARVVVEERPMGTMTGVTTW